MSASTTNGGRPDAVLEAALNRDSRADEQAVLGALMMASPDSSVPGEIRELLRPGDGTPGVGEHHFAIPRHAMIYRMIIELMDRGETFGMLEVAAALPVETLQRAGGVPYLHACIESCPTIGNGTAYARNIVNATLLRRLAQNAAKTAQLALSSALTDAEDIFDRVRADLATIELPGRSGGPVPWEVAGPRALDEMERLAQLAENPDLDSSEFCTPWPDLDRLLCPVAPGSLVIIAGRPGMAKSTSARNIARHMSMAKKLPTLFFSLEMSEIEISLSMLAEGARLKLNDIKHGTLDDEGWVRAGRYIGETAEAPFEVDDTAGANLAYVDRQLASFVRRHGRAPAAFFVDYAQLSDERGHGTRQEAVSAMSRGFKLLAKKHSTVCVLLSQLNRGPELRADKLPQLSDLRESGSLEQDADIVILLHREDYYDKESPRAGEIDFIVAKHRGGPTDTVHLAAQLHMSRIVSMAIN